MPTAETARLIASFELQDKFSGPAGRVEGKVAGLEKATNRLGSGGAVASKSLGTMGKAATGFGGALGHAGNAVKGLVGSMGPLLGAGGLLGVGALLTTSIGKAEEFSVTIAKVRALTGQTTEATSAYVDVLDKFGVDSDKAVKLTGIMEKNLGALAGTQKKAAEFQKQYGISLTDTSGKIIDANTLLFRARDYFNSSATASQKAAVLNKLYGKSWQDLIPILSQGESQLKAEFSGALQLSSAQTKAIDQFRSAQREFADEIGDLQVVIGAELLPALIGPLRETTDFLSAHRKDIVEFFKGGVNAAKELGGAIKSLAPFARSIVDAWNAIPADLRKLILGGLVANKVLKMTIGFDPLNLTRQFAQGFLEGLGGELFKRGSPGNPMFTKEVGIPGVAGGGKGGGGGLNPLGVIGAALGGLSIAALVKSVVLDPQLQAQTSQIAADAQRQIASKPGEQTLTDALHAVEEGIRKLDNPIGRSLYGDQIAELERVKAMYVTALGDYYQTLNGLDKLSSRDRATASANIGQGTQAVVNGVLGALGKFGIGGGASQAGANRANAGVATLAPKLDTLHRDFIAQRALLARGNDRQQAAAATRLAALVQKGVGNAANTNTLLRQLRAARLHVTDPESRRALDAAIRRVQAKIPGREWIQRQLNQGARIIASTRSVHDKAVQIANLQRSLIARGDSHAAAQLGALHGGFASVVDAVRRINFTVNQITNGTGVTRTGSSQRQHTGTGTSGGYVDAGGGRGGGRASGGPVWPGWRGFVGENGPEWLDLYSSGRGMVTPLPTQRQPVVVHVHAPNQVSTRDITHTTQVYRRISPVRDS